MDAGSRLATLGAVGEATREHVAARVDEEVRRSRSVQEVAGAARRPTPSRDPTGRAARARAADATFAFAPNEMSNAPSDSSRICSHSSSTVRTSGLASSTASSPRPMRMISVSGRHVLKRSSTRANHASHASMSALGDATRVEPHVDADDVPHCSTTRRTDCMASLSVLVAGLVECALQRLRVALAGVRRAADDVDLRALRLQHLLQQERRGLLADLGRALAVDRHLERGDVGDLGPLQRHSHLDGAVPVVERIAVDGADCARMRWSAWWSAVDAACRRRRDRAGAAGWGGRGRDGGLDRSADDDLVGTPGDDLNVASATSPMQR